MSKELYIGFCKGIKKNTKLKALKTLYIFQMLKKNSLITLKNKNKEKTA